MISIHYLLLKHKIDDAKWRINLAKKSVSFWLAEVAELSQKYANSEFSWEQQHLSSTQNYLQQAQDEMRFWQNNLQDFQSQMIEVFPRAMEAVQA